MIKTTHEAQDEGSYTTMEPSEIFNIPFSLIIDNIVFTILKKIVKIL